MKRNSENEALIGIGKLEQLAQAYGRTGKTLQKLARSLRKVTEEVRVHGKVTEAATRQPRAKATPPKKKGMSPAARKRLSDAMKKRWAEKKAQAKGPKLARRANDEPVGNGQRGQVA